MQASIRYAAPRAAGPTYCVEISQRDNASILVAVSATNEGASMRHIGTTVAFIALLSFLGGSTVAGQEPETVVDMVVNGVDDTTCADGIGRTFRSATVLSAAQNDYAEAFFARHEACAGMSDRAASVGLTPLPVGLTAKCSGAVALPGLQYDWVICQLGFLAKESLTTPVHIELGDFVLLTQGDQKFAPYVDADLYVGQLYDMSAGIDFLGPDPAYGDIAFPVSPDSVQPPFVILWEKSGDFIIADELEPNVAEFFIRDMQAG
jgi:hypothetical protein